jgi:O-antigen/teichoic acid export membrane protein
MKVGGLSVVNSIGLSLTVIVVTAFIGRFGSDALAGYGLGSRLELMLIGFAFGLGGALVTAVGGNVGAGQMRRARRIAWTGAGITLLSTAVIGLFVAIMPGLWVDRFTSDPAVHAIAVSYLRIAAPVFGLFCGGYTLYFASQGTGNMIIPVSITWVRLLVVAGICFAAAIFDWGLDTVFVGVAVGLVVVAAGHVLNVLKGPGWRYDWVGWIDECANDLPFWTVEQFLEPFTSTEHINTGNTPPLVTSTSLTLRRQKFVSEYVETGNATEAARLDGYSPRTAYSLWQQPGLFSPQLR